MKRTGLLRSSILKPALAAAILPLLAVADRTPSVPDNLKVPDGNKVAFRAYAVGVQIYVCTQSATDPTQFTWVFKAPEAVLFADSAGHGEVAIHYGGPTWESNSGSKVVGAVLERAPVPGTIPWLLLRATSEEGPGIFEGITYIQRLNTAGGAAPTTNCDAEHVGQEAHVPYTAEYCFYRERQ